MALCDLPSGEKICSAPLPSNPVLDLAVGTQQGVVFLRPRRSRAWRDRLGVG